MAPPARGFPTQEFEARTAAAQALMAEAGFDILLFTTEENIRYFSGFLTQFFQSPTRPWFLLVPREGKPVAVIPSIGEVAMARTWIEDIRCWSSPTDGDDGIEILAQAIRDLSGNGPVVGLPKDRETHLRLPLLEFDKLRRSLPQATFIDATSIIRTLRMVKSDREIEKTRYICAAVSRAFDRADDLFEIGQADTDAFRAFKIACLEEGADDVSYLVGGAGPGGYDDIISPPNGRPLQEGDIFILDTGSVFDGYFSDFDRNFGFGSADDLSRRAYDCVWQATEAGLAAATPGAMCSDIFRAMQSVLSEMAIGANDVGRLGHGLGMQLTEWPSHTAFDHTVLQPGMVITLEPGLTYAPGKVMVHEENIVIRDGEPELLSTRAAAELPLLN